MGAIRSFFLVFVSSILLLSIFSSVLFLTISSSLDYPVLEKESTNLTKELLLSNTNINSAIDEAYPFMQIYCQTNSNYVFGEGEYTFTISCAKLSEGKEALVEDAFQSKIKDIYYKEYNCEFIDCVKNVLNKGEMPLFLFSKLSYSFFYNLFIIALIISLTLLISAFFLVERKNSLPILTGVLLVFSSLPFFKIRNLLTLIPEKMIANVVGLFFSQSSSLALNTFIFGFVLIILGIILKLLSIATFTQNFFSKFKKENKEENKSKEKLVEEKKDTKNKK